MVGIVNKTKLIKNARGENKKAREVAIKVLESALDSANPQTSIKKHVHRYGNTLRIDDLTFNLKSFQRIFVVGGGKASGSMAEALERVMGDMLTKGFVNILRGTKPKFKIKKIFLNEAGHPLPDRNGLVGTRKINRIVSEANKNDLIICLISGGGSALMPLPPVGITLRDQQKLTALLLKCGATINEINTVRKHISKLKAGQLARAAYPATLISLIFSDVVGDPLDSIASGPTTSNTTTFSDAFSILKRYDVWQNIPEVVKKRLKAGLKGKIPENPKRGNKIFGRTYNIVIGSNRSAVLAASRKARRFGLDTLVLSTMIEGEARHVGTVLAGIVREILSSENPLSKPAVVIAGGETTVTVTGNGKGGRNQELVLSASLKIDGLKGVAIASASTDGIDGSTDAAGAIVDGQTITRARNKNLNPRKFLMNNDSYKFFSEVDDLIFTGPTDTNVNDIIVMVVV